MKEKEIEKMKLDNIKMLSMLDEIVNHKTFSSYLPTTNIKLKKLVQELNSGNNGWIKIESEEDLPKKDFYKGYHTFPIDFTCNSYGLHKYFRTKEITHYQPIIKPLPPTE